MDFKKIEDVTNFLKDNIWNSEYEHNFALGIFNQRELDYIFDKITKNSSSPIIYESGCGTGVTTSQIIKNLKQRKIQNYKLIAHDINEHLINYAKNRFSKNNKIDLELRTGSNYSDILPNSIDGIFSFNTMIPFLAEYYFETKDISQHRDYLEQTSRILKEQKPIVLTYIRAPLVLIKNSEVKRNIPFQIKTYDEHESIKPFLKLLDFNKPINNIEYLEKLLGEGYTIKGPRDDFKRDLASFKAFLKRGKEFASEDWLLDNDYKFVGPNTFTNEHIISYKLIDDFLDERFSSNYSLIKNGREIPLFLEVEPPKQETEVVFKKL